MGFLSRRRIPAANQDNSKPFPTGIKLVYAPDNGEIEYVPSWVRKRSP